MRSRWLGALIVLAVLTALALQAGVVARAGFAMGDFRAFYCAARVASHGENPYHTQPLQACEAQIVPRSFQEKNPGVTIPAPLPAYAIAVLVPLAALPFGVSAAIWAAVLLAAWVAAIVALARAAGIAWEIALAALSLGFGVLSLPFGEVVPLAVAGICGAAYYARAGRWRAAAACAALAMIEPHLGLPAAFALALWAPRARLPLALLALGLASLALALLGPAANLEYFLSVLPAHALSEATRDTQYSLTAVLAAAGMPLHASVQAGALWYAAMLVLGVVVGLRLARESGNSAFAVCVPPAFAVFGGTFIHITQIAAALPAALLCVGAIRPARRPIAVAALLLLAVPWGWAVSPALIVAPLVPVAYLAWRYWSANVSAVLLAGIVAAVLLLGLRELYTLPKVHVGGRPATPAIDTRLPEASWSAYSQRSSTATLAAWAVRVPTWSALFVLLALLAADAATLGVAARPRLGYLTREIS